MKRNARRPNVTVTTGGQGVVAHAGARLLCDLADELGLTGALSARWRRPSSAGAATTAAEVLVDMAVAIADGATTLSDLRVLADQPATVRRGGLGGHAWRTLEAIDEAALGAIAEARATARAAAWAAGLDPGFYVIDLDATLVGAHSEKEGAAPTYKHGFGFSPLVAFLDATGEALAACAPGQRRAGHGRRPRRSCSTPPWPSCRSTRRDRGHRPDRLGRAARMASRGLPERGVRFIVGHRLSTELGRRR